MSLEVIAMGRYLPRRVVDNHEVSKLIGKSPDWISRHCGVSERRWVTDESAPAMAAAAAREALAKAEIEPSRVDLVLNASGTPWQVLPDGSAHLIQELGLSCAGFSVHSTCLGFLSALHLADALLRAGSYRLILISVSEVCSQALNFAQPESASLFGDGAVAVLVGPSRGNSRLLKSAFRTYPEGCSLTEIRGGGSRRHPANPLTRPEDNLFSMDGAALLRLARRQLPLFLEALKPGLTHGLQDISRVFPHQASRFGLAMLQRFHWPQEQVETVLPLLGNVVAASIPLCLYQAEEEGRLKRGDKLLLLGVGAGMSLGAILLEY